MSLLVGRAKKFDGTAIDYVSIFTWTNGKCIGQATPDASGNWYYYHHADTQVGITYVADGCEPITHGAYTVERNNDLNPVWFVINSPFATNMTDLTGKIWAVHGSANVSNGALQLNGTNYIDMPYIDSIDFSDSQDVTIRFKANILSFNSGYKYVVTTRKDDSSATSNVTGWALVAQTNGIEVAIWDGANGGVILSKKWVVDIFNKPVELSFERKNMVWRLYVDGVQHGDAATQTKNYIYAPDSMLTIGADANDTNGYTGNPDRYIKGSFNNLQILKGVALGYGGVTTPLIG